MIAKLHDWIESMSGSMSETHYTVPYPGRPGWVIIKKRPGPRKPEGRRAKDWKLPEGQARGVDKLMLIQSVASAEYHDPIKRAQWEKEFRQWTREQSAHGRDIYHLHGKLCRYLWDFVRISVQWNMEHPDDALPGNDDLRPTND